MGILLQKEEEQSLLNQETWTSLGTDKSATPNKNKESCESNPENQAVEVTRRDFVIITVLIIIGLIIFLWIKSK
ncbi:MAG: hypothetical protein Q3996_01110 [Candidatus Saccharibacteria bacterium]|nr:hypothetical protein [Candidatus Saccharibacteria bacterium]